MLAHDSRETVC